MLDEDGVPDHVTQERGKWSAVGVILAIVIVAAAVYFGFVAWFDRVLSPHARP